MSSFEPVTERVVEIGLGVNFVRRGIEIVGHTAIRHRHGVRIKYCVAGTGILITRLTDAADIDQQFCRTQRIGMIAFLGWNELTRRCEYARQMGMPHEAVLIDLAEQNLHLPRVVNVFGEHVFVGRITRRTVNETIGFLVDESRQLAQEVPACVDLGLAAVAGIELVTSPVNCPQGHRVESVRIKQSRLIVVAQDRPFAAPHDQVKALARIGSITDDVAQTIDIVDTDGINVGYDSLQGFQVTVDIADQCSLHENSRTLSINSDIPTHLARVTGHPQGGPDPAPDHPIVGSGVGIVPFMKFVQQPMQQEISRPPAQPTTATSLAIEVIGREGSIALLNGNSVIVAQPLATDARAAASLGRAIADLVAEYLPGGTLDSLAYLAVASGPGSFTGLRIAVTTAKTLAYALEIPLVAVNSLAAIADLATPKLGGVDPGPVPASPSTHSILVGLAAYRGQVYRGKFAAGGAPEIGIISAAEWKLEVIGATASMDAFAENTQKNNFIFAGEIAVFLAAGASIAPARWCGNDEVRAVGVGRVASKMFSRGEITDPLTLVPDYLRPSSAEEQVDS